jgi:hypothetical protein
VNNAASGSWATAVNNTVSDFNGHSKLIVGSWHPPMSISAQNVHYGQSDVGRVHWLALTDTYRNSAPCYTHSVTQEPTENCNTTDKKADFAIVHFNLFPSYDDWATVDIGSNFREFVARHEFMHVLGYHHLACAVIGFPGTGFKSLHGIQPAARAKCDWPFSRTSHDNSDISNDY